MRLVSSRQRFITPSPPPSPPGAQANTRAHWVGTTACLDVAPLGARVALQTLVAAVHVPPAHAALRVLLAVGGGAPVVLGVGGGLVVGHGLRLAVRFQLRVIWVLLKSLWRLPLLSRGS